MIVGCDPGMMGGIALVDRQDDKLRLVDAIRVPILTAGRTKVLDAMSVLRWMEWHTSGSATVVLEAASSRPAQGVASSFSFGRIAGALEAVLRAGAPNGSFHWTTPARWKRELGLGPKKQASLDLATLWFGEEARQRCWPHKGDHGVAEAALIAGWWLEKRRS